MSIPLASTGVSAGAGADGPECSGTRAVLLASGVDRPGLLDEISSFLLERRANICDSRLINLHGTFAILLLIRADDERAIDAIREDLPRLAAGSRIHLDLQPADDHREKESFAYRFTATGADQAGLLQKISHLFRALNINIDHV